MSSGLAWAEGNVRYNSSANSAIQMLRQSDHVQFVLNRPMAEAPGTRFNYNSGGSHLLSAILQSATGMDTFAFAQTRLFQPLGITDVEWPADPTGIRYGSGGIWMTSRDMAKLGYLYLHNGAWDGQQVIPSEWVVASSTPHMSVTATVNYGYQWWVQPSGAYWAQGWGGQYIWVIPKLDMVVVVTGGFSNPALEQSLVEFFIIPAAKSEAPLVDDPAATTQLQARITAAGQADRVEHRLIFGTNHVDVQSRWVVEGASYQFQGKLQR